MAESTAKQHLREYETVFLMKPDLTDDAVDKMKERVRGIVDRDGGKMIRFTIWGKKKLAYPIEKQNRAIFVHAHYLGGGGMVAEIERNLRIVDEVTRYISSRIADDVDPSTRETLEDVKMAGDVEERPLQPGVPDATRPESGAAAAAAPVAAPAADAVPEKHAEEEATTEEA